MLRIWPGTPYPLGATRTGVGVKPIFSAHATRVELCLFDKLDATREAFRKRWPAAGS